MAMSTIAGAPRAGKGALSRADILRDAHRRTRWLRARAAFPRSYADTFPGCLRAAWRAAKEHAELIAFETLLAAEDAAIEAAEAAIPANTAALLTAIRLEAESQNFTSYGNERPRTLLAQADDIAQAARCMMIPATRDHAHAVH